MNNTFNEVIVVEGNHDKAKILSVFPGADIEITNGKEISETTLEALKTLNQQRGLILMLDPDVPGEAIRKHINDYVGETKHVFLPKHLCVDTVKQKVGIEHASKETIISALKHHVHESDNNIFIPRKALLSRGLIGMPNSAQKRQQVIDAYNLGLCNGKTFHKKINRFNITLNMIDAVIK